MGYADRASIRTGEPLRLYVSTTARRFSVRVFRMGWYGGHEGRLIATRNDLPGRRQPTPVLLAPRHTVEARWTMSTVLGTAGWSPGDYLLRLDASSGVQSYVPLTARGTSAFGRMVLVSPTTTWQAYNTWGCCNLYAGADGTFASRSRAVSFDRPYAAGDGAAEFLTRELPVVALAERMRLPLDYVTDTDLQTPGALSGAAAVVSMGHDEYWSPGMRAAVTQARDTGSNVAFLGANAVYRRIRLASTRLGPDRLIIDYKIANEDPLFRRDPAAVTSDWPQPPRPRPESSLTGAMYLCFNRLERPGVVTDPEAFPFSGTGVRQGELLPGLIGPEIDMVDRADPTPRGLRIVMRSPFPCPMGVSGDAEATLYRAPSGALVFDAGTMNWVGSMVRHDMTGRVVRRATANLLRRFAQPRP